MITSGDGPGRLLRAGQSPAHDARWMNAVAAAMTWADWSVCGEWPQTQLEQLRLRHAARDAANLFERTLSASWP